MFRQRTCYQTTYKELKLGKDFVAEHWVCGYQTTYKELKPIKGYKIKGKVPVIRLPIRN